MRALPILLFCLAIVAAPNAFAAGGPLGIDHRIHFDNRGLWKRSNQNVLIYGTLTTVVGGALAFGNQDELGDTFWRSVDALAVTGLATEGLKLTFQCERPSQTNDPDRFFAGTHAQSFPSGEVAAISAAVTPFIVKYGSDHPAVYALALLPVYDAVARVKPTVTGKATCWWARRSAPGWVCGRHIDNLR